MRTEGPRYFIEKFATRVWMLENGQITDFKGTYSAMSRWLVGSSRISRLIRLSMSIQRRRRGVPGAAGAVKNPQARRC